MRITYAVHPDGFVVSRVDSQIVWPILDYEAIGKDGDYTKPFIFTWEKMSVHSIGREWNLLKWTRKIPTEVKNFHRQLWGMPPLNQ